MYIVVSLIRGVNDRKTKWKDTSWWPRTDVSDDKSSFRLVYHPHSWTRRKTTDPDGQHSNCLEISKTKFLSHGFWLMDLKRKAENKKKPPWQNYCVPKLSEGCSLDWSEDLKTIVRGTSLTITKTRIFDGTALSPKTDARMSSRSFQLVQQMGSELSLGEFQHLNSSIPVMLSLDRSDRQRWQCELRYPDRVSHRPE